jgi:hypothetical protein
MQQLETDSPPFPKALFMENSNNMCFTTTGLSPCHQEIPSNYPADETSRIPEGFDEAGYFEYNSGGTKIRGVEYRSRWPGAVIYNNSGISNSGYYFSPHRNDPDMPRIDPQDHGSCLNCHDPHAAGKPFDMLKEEYRSIGGFDEPTYPSRYELCFTCHSSRGASGMDNASKRIQEYYDSSINYDGAAGHQIRLDPDIAISWPSHIHAGDKLPCSDCHNPHGSRGYNGEGPNAFLISDERSGWANLTDTANDPDQSRRFCLGCHIPSDGIPGSRIVQGIVMNTLPVHDAHVLNDFRGCFECHGGDYSTATSFNVHHPRQGS